MERRPGHRPSMVGAPSTHRHTHHLRLVGSRAATPTPEGAVDIRPREEVADHRILAAVEARRIREEVAGHPSMVVAELAVVPADRVVGPVGVVDPPVAVAAAAVVAALRDRQVASIGAASRWWPT